MKRVLVDMDGVLADVYHRFIDLHEEESGKQTVFCGRKDIIPADIMIDDHPKNLDKFKGETIIFTQPHNMNSVNSRHHRVVSWTEIEKLLLNS